MGDIETVGATNCKGSVWKKTRTPCLVKYEPAGTYYLRARVGGEPYREALGTDVYEVARRKLADRLHELRLARGGKTSETPKKLVDALLIVRAQTEQSAAIKIRTRKDYLDDLARLMPGQPCAMPSTDLSRLSRADIDGWWQAVRRVHGPQRSNNLLMLVRRALKAAHAAGSLVGDPTEHIRRAKIPRRAMTLVSLDQFRLVVESIRGQRKAHSHSSADWVEFQAYSGLRPAEMLSVLWSHVDEPRACIWVHGGAEGTKGGESRPVPILPDMARLLGEMRGRAGEPAGRIFPRAASPREALWGACRRLAFPRLRIYDLRHLFATACNSAGVDVPTFAKWLGHKDGGTLAMRTYVHPHDEHSRESAAKVKFS